MKKVDKEQWFIVGLDVLAKDGFARITIDNLCGLLQITKGAFYHHFKNIDGYIDALMKYWLNQNTIQVIEEADKLPSAKERIEFIGNAVIQRLHKSEQVIRAWGFSSPIVKKYVQQVDDLRIEYSTKQRVLLGLSEEEAKNITVLEYAIFVGGQQLFPDMDKKELEQLYLFYCQKLQSSELK
ncbi:TetR/AcrR family transcriptional regulator [Bacteroides sp.]|uniref:TetR/AcrR family transcriptional regulator n=1 Tax=Bacteroides sp. TaxID=29523 RepID=UPI00262D3F94|nr:TetR/AcrR family transcriptional regulator [Bacteroides sp.]MDD3039254.1 TetR/AcrR family transcriptional regulator [Bacteroides sp.]